MRIGLAPLVFLIGCSTNPAENNIAPGNRASSTVSGSSGPTASPRSATSPVTLSPQAQANVCPPPAIGWPFDFDVPVGNQFSFECRVYDDVDEGGWGVCCGGDLRVQSCGPGLSCWQPYPGRFGICGAVTPPVPWAPRDEDICVDIWSPYVAPNDCQLVTNRDNDGNCLVMANCGNSQHVISCADGNCQCTNDNAFLPDIPASDVCAGSMANAIAVAQARCAFPPDADFVDKVTQW